MILLNEVVLLVASLLLMWQAFVRRDERLWVVCAVFFGILASANVGVVDGNWLVNDAGTSMLCIGLMLISILFVFVDWISNYAPTTMFSKKMMKLPLIGTGKNGGRRKHE